MYEYVFLVQNQPLYINIGDLHTQFLQVTRQLNSYSVVT